MSGEAYLPPAFPAGSVTPAGDHTDGHRANPRRFSQIMSEGMTWVRKQLPGPGAMNYAYDSLALAESTPIGPGVRQRQYWATISAPLFMPNITRPMSGYGGVAQGQYIGQPLYDPYNNQFGNIMGPQS